MSSVEHTSNFNDICQCGTVTTHIKLNYRLDILTAMLINQTEDVLAQTEKQSKCLVY